MSKYRHSRQREWRRKKSDFIIENEAVNTNAVVFMDRFPKLAKLAERGLLREINISDPLTPDSSYQFRFNAIPVADAKTISSSELRGKGIVGLMGNHNRIGIFHESKLAGYLEVVSSDIKHKSSLIPGIVEPDLAMPEQPTRYVEEFRNLQVLKAALTNLKTAADFITVFNKLDAPMAKVWRPDAPIIPREFSSIRASYNDCVRGPLMLVKSSATFRTEVEKIAIVTDSNYQLDPKAEFSRTAYQPQVVQNSLLAMDLDKRARSLSYILEERDTPVDILAAGRVAARLWPVQAGLQDAGLKPQREIGAHNLRSMFCGNKLEELGTEAVMIKDCNRAWSRCNHAGILVAVPK